jgi:hypothetical protein
MAETGNWKLETWEYNGTQINPKSMKSRTGRASADEHR